MQLFICVWVLGLCDASMRVERCGQWAALGG